MLRRTLLSIVALGLICLPALGANVGELVGVDDDFWGLSIGDVDNSAQASEPYGVFQGALDMATVNGWLTAGGVHSFALIPPAATYYGNSSLPLAGVPDVGVQEMTLTLSDWSTVTVPLTNAAHIKRGIAQGAEREFYYDDMNFHDHESPDCNPLNGGPRPVLYQVDLTAQQGQSVVLDPSLDLRASGFSESGKTFDVYEVTEAYDYTTVTYGSLVYGGEIPELPPVHHDLEAVKDQVIEDGSDVPYEIDYGDEIGAGLDGRPCWPNGNQSSAIIMGFDLSTLDPADNTAAGDGFLSMKYGWAASTEGIYEPVAIYELLGDENWDETTVTGVNFCTDGDVSNCFGDLCSAEAPTEVGNWVRTEHTIPQASIQKLLDGEIIGFALTSAAGGFLNSCTYLKDAHWTLQASPTLRLDVTTGGTQIPGDANGDGVVSDADYTIWADNYGQSGASWDMGDFNGDGEVSDADYTIWADNYGAGGGDVPEPTTMALVALGGLAMIRRKR
jgi:PEP-CTERM motif-containing protein